MKSLAFAFESFFDDALVEGLSGGGRSGGAREGGCRVFAEDSVLVRESPGLIEALFTEDDWVSLLADCPNSANTCASIFWSIPQLLATFCSHRR